MKIILVPLIITLTLFLEGCSSKNNIEPSNSLDKYLEEKKSAEDNGLEFNTLDSYLESKSVIEEKIAIKKGSKLNDIISSLIKIEDNKYKFIFNETKNFTFLENEEGITFDNLEQFSEYINFNDKFSFKIIIKQKSKYKKIIVKWPTVLAEKLKGIKLETGYRINPLIVIENIFSQLKEDIHIDASVSDSLNKNKSEFFNGNAYEYIKLITNKNNLFLNITEDNVNISKYKSKIYDILITPLMISTSSSNTLSGESDGTQNSNIKFGYQIYTELENNIKNIVGKNGSYFLNRASGQLTVRAKKENLETIDEIIKGFNDMYSKQVEVKIDILEIKLSEEHKNGIDLGVLRVSNIPGINGDIGYSSSFNDMITSNPVNTLSFTSKSGRTQGLIQAMNIFGDVSVTSRPVLKTLNSIPAVLDVGVDTEYLSKITSTAATENTAASFETENSNAKDGLKIFIYPRVMNNNKILLTISPTINSVLSLEDLVVGSTNLKTKTMNNRTFNNTLSFKNGETIILAGLLTEYKSKSKSGLPYMEQEDSWSDYIGGNKYTNNEKTELVLAVTVNILDL